MASNSSAYKKAERDNWNKFSARYTAVVLPEFHPFGRRLIELADVQKGMWVLDVATGPGEPALSVARRVGPGGLVVGVDFSPVMVRRARARARTLRLAQAQFREMDAERLRFNTMTFDRVFCRFGLMLMPAATRALKEMHRVLVPGGRVVLAVWSRQSKVNTLRVVSRVIERYDISPRQTGAPNFFRFGRRGILERMLRTAGFRQIRTERMTVEWIFKGPEEFWKSMKGGPSLRRALSRVSPAIRREIKCEVLRSLEKFRRSGRLRLPNEAVLAVGIKVSAP